MQATRFILIRHAETAANRELRYIGSRDDVLTEHGQQQAQLLAAALVALPLRAVYSSPRRRAYDTAQPIAERLGLPVETAEDLRENSFGAWEGMSRAEVLAHSSEYAAHLAAWEADTAIAPPDGESMADMSTRVTDFALGCLAKHAGQTIVVVSHVGPVKALIATTLGTSLAVMRRMFLDSATVSVVDWSDGQRILRLFNSHAHLGWTSARWM
jgi:ribonuclease H / adenosylcobalamin/alpha-ribazole phosphatase